MTIQKLQETGPWRIYTVCTGGGALLSQRLWEKPGASKLLVGHAFPYATDCTTSFLGFEPTGFCSDKTAIQLAMESYKRAWKADGAPAIGLGLTASVASNRMHRGDHRVFVSTVTDTKIHLYSAILEKGVGESRRNRDNEICTNLALNALFEAAGCDANFGYDGIIAFNSCELEAEEIENIFWENPCFDSSGLRFSDVPGNDVIFYPGSFNPIHFGHLSAAQAAMKASGQRCYFNVTSTSPHKDNLTVQQCLQKAAAFDGKNVLFTRNDPLYIDKVIGRPNSNWIIGADALLTMFSNKWCANQQELVSKLEKSNPVFYVFGRLVNGNWVSADDAIRKLPTSNMWKPVDGRWDISSTEIRNK